MKKFAIFLPQFHIIPENNKWWGEGFTEWTNVKKGTPLFRGHKQPREPLNDNYYNLLDKSTVQWQTDLLNKYKIDGFAYYHYYFNGNMLLEKPAENLLKWKDINQKFFFIWANHSWIRSWQGKSDILMEQTYGKEADWEKHFQYLLKFFRDDRYEKKDNMPVFGIFKSDFAEKNDMFEYWNRRCKEEGFAGMYIFESYGGESRRSLKSSYTRFLKSTSSKSKAIAIRQPAFAEYGCYPWLINLFYVYYRRWMKSNRRKNNMPLILNGNKLVEKSLKRKIPESSKDIIPGIFFEWDNTPRHKGRGYIITPIDKAHFRMMMDHYKNNEYLLINAWNEWCEGMILEPTKENGYKYLEWLKEWTDDHE